MSIGALAGDESYYLSRALRVRDLLLGYAATKYDYLRRDRRLRANELPVAAYLAANRVGAHTVQHEGRQRIGLRLRRRIAVPHDTDVVWNVAGVRRPDHPALPAVAPVLVGVVTEGVELFLRRRGVRDLRMAVGRQDPAR